MVDNYDSFVYTIVGYLNQLGAETVVVRNDAVPPVAERTGFDGVLVSPRTGHPRRRRRRACRSSATAPTPACRCSGVCLGHQALGEVFGGDRHARPRAHARQDEPGRARRRGRARRAARPVHRDAVPLARGRGRHGLRRARGHRDAAPRHHHGPAAPRRCRCTGCSSTPSRVLTEGGHRLLANWLEICGDDQAVGALGGAAPARPPLTARHDEGAVPAGTAPSSCRLTASVRRARRRRRRCRPVPATTWMSICWSSGDLVARRRDRSGAPCRRARRTGRRSRLTLVSPSALQLRRRPGRTSCPTGRSGWSPWCGAMAICRLMTAALLDQRARRRRPARRPCRASSSDSTGDVLTCSLASLRICVASACGLAGDVGHQRRCRWRRTA